MIKILKIIKKNLKNPEKETWMFAFIYASGIITLMSTRHESRSVYIAIIFPASLWFVRHRIFGVCGLKTNFRGSRAGLFMGSRPVHTLAPLSPGTVATWPWHGEVFGEKNTPCVSTNTPGCSAWFWDQSASSQEHAQGKNTKVDANSNMIETSITYSLRNIYSIFELEKGIMRHAS